MIRFHTQFLHAFSALLLVGIILDPMAGMAEEALKTTEDEQTQWIAVPFGAYDTDNGAIYGAHSEFLFGPSAAETPRARLSLLFRGSTRGNWHGRLRHDQPAERRPGATGFQILGEWRHWERANFFGIGNATLGVEGAGAAGNDRTPAHHGLSQALLRWTSKQMITRSAALYGALGLSWSRVAVHADSILAAESPFGVDGGMALELTGGALLDTTDDRTLPRRGVRAELGVRGAPPLPQGSGHWVGVLGNIAGYHALSDRITLAGQIRVEHLWGRIPFYEMNCWGGRQIQWGFGGSTSLRGALFGRWLGPGKLIANGEIRADVGTHVTFNTEFAWQVVPFMDLGAVFGAPTRDPGLLLFAPVHPSAGIGARIHIDRTFLLRVDVGVGVDGTKLPNGATQSRPLLGTYVTFGQLF